MRAIILAAGTGARLAPPGEERPPKCLLRLGGKTLLQRQLRALRRVEVEEVALVVGYGAEQVEAELRAVGASPAPRLVRNPRYEEGSVVSLWCAREALAAGDDVLLMDADVLCDARVLERLAAAPRPDCFLLDRELEQGEEPVKICVRGGVPVEFRKRIEPGLEYDFAGESVGFFRLSASTARRLAERAEGYVRGGRAAEPYEEVLRDELLDRPPGGFGFVEVTGLPWIEIDFPEDLRRAEREILPALRED